jgi:hypothetical protein
MKRPHFDQTLFGKAAEATERLAYWANRAAELQAQGKLEQARKALKTAENWQKKKDAYERRLNPSSK